MAKFEKEATIINKHKKMICEAEHIEVNDYRHHRTIINHTIEHDDKTIIFTAAIKMELSDPECKKLLNSMIENQESPVITKFKKIERENRRLIKNGESYSPLYNLPEELEDIIN